MIKQHISWQGHDGKPANQTAYFNLDHFEIAHDMELETLQARFQSFQDNVIDDGDRDMTPPEIRELLDIFKILIKHAYGIRSLDGKKFSKSEEIWQDFVDTGAFNAFLWDMFKDPKKVNGFMLNIWPDDISKGVRESITDTSAPSPAASDDDVPDISSGVPDISSLPPVAPNAPDDRSLEEFTDQELLSLSDEGFNSLMSKNMQGKNIPPRLLRIAMRRNGSEGDGTEE